jgi:hypothetical protein
MEVYEKAFGISRWLLGFVELRELLLEVRVIVLQDYPKSPVEKRVTLPENSSQVPMYINTLQYISGDTP